MSDIQSIQVCSGLEQNRRHLQRSPCNPDNLQSRPDFPSHMESLYRSYSVQRQSTSCPFAFKNIRSSTPVINAIHYVVSLFGMGNPNNERNNLKISVAFKFKQITTNTHSKVNIDSRLLNYQWICTTSPDSK